MPSPLMRPYSLPRHGRESLRLNQQHHVYRSAVGFSLHPVIPLEEQRAPLKIIEIATGTGVWLLELAAQSPAAWSFVGTDISVDQFPVNAPTNCTFTPLDILAPVPPELQSQFDVVHVRHLVLALRGEQFSTVATNILKLVKPGGWIQWQEVHPDSIQVLQNVPNADTHSCENLIHTTVELYNRYGDVLHQASHLVDTLIKCGYQDCRKDTFSTDRDPLLRSLNTSVCLQVCLLVLRNYVETDPDSIWTLEQAEQLATQCEQECEADKIYWRADTSVATGRRPF